MNFGKASSGWAKGSGSNIRSRVFSDIYDDRCTAYGKVMGMEIIRPMNVFGPIQDLVSDMIVVGSDAEDLEMVWEESGVETALTMARSGKYLWMTNMSSLPIGTDGRLIIRFSNFTNDVIQPLRRLYGVWMMDQTLDWMATVTKDGVAWDGATGATTAVDLAASMGTAVLTRPFSVVCSGFTAGDYDFTIWPQTTASSAAQSSGNTTFLEQEQNIGLPTIIKVRV